MDFYRKGTKLVACLDIAITVIVVILTSVLVGFTLMSSQFVPSFTNEKATNVYFVPIFAMVIVSCNVLELVAGIMLLVATISTYPRLSALPYCKVWGSLNVIWAILKLIIVFRMCYAMLVDNSLSQYWAVVAIFFVEAIFRSAGIFIVSKFMGKLRSAKISADVDGMIV